MNGYTKLFQSLVTSSLWTESDRTRIVWITILAMADKHGEIQASVPGLARLAGVPVEDCEKAIELFLSPDRHSRTPDHDGRRIEKIDGGWAILNHAKYRLMASDADRKNQSAERVKRHRERYKALHVTPSNAPLRTGNADVMPERDKADTEAKAEADSKAQPLTPLPPFKGEAAPAATVVQNAPSAVVTPPAPEKPQGGPKADESAASKKRTTPMQIPSIEEVKLHAAKIGLPETEAFKFHGYYESNGWRVGSNPMKSWVGAMTNWKGKYDERRTTSNSGSNHRGNGADGNPRNAGIAGFDEWHRDFQARAVGDGQHGPWDDFGRGPEVAGADPEAGRVTPPTDSEAGASGGMADQARVLQ